MFNSVNRYIYVIWTSGHHVHRASKNIHYNVKPLHFVQIHIGTETANCIYYIFKTKLSRPRIFYKEFVYVMILFNNALEAKT